MDCNEDKYQLLINPEIALVFSFESWLFSEQSYVNQFDTEKNFFYWFNLSSQKVDGIFIIQNFEHQGWTNGFRSTFSDFDCVQGLNCKPFLIEIKQALQQLKIQKCVFKPSPNYLKLNLLDEFKDIFTEHEVLYTELNYHLVLNDFDFHQSIHSSKKWRLNKLLKNDFKFEQIQHVDLDLIHHFIKEARERKGFPMTINLSEFVNMTSLFSNRYTFFCVKNGAEMVAVSVCVNLGKGVFYNFYSADHADYTKESPMILLYKGMFDYAKINQYKYFDLGIASYLGERNEGLISFKKSIGAIESDKIIFQFNP